MSDNELTKDYADRLARSIEELEALHDLVGAGAVSNDDELTEALQDASAEALSALADLGGAQELERQDYEPMRAYFDDVLEVRYYLKGSLGNHAPELYEVEALLTFGGPNAYAKTNADQEWVTVDVYWGGGHETRRVYAPGYASWLWELVKASI